MSPCIVTTGVIRPDLSISSNGVVSTKYNVDNE